jgi:endo-1,4-beta-xylanase
MTPAGSGPSLRELAERRKFRIGAAVNEGPLRDDPEYRAILAREFNIVTPENAMKFGPLRPTRDVYAFEDADAIVAFAQQHGIAVRGHALLWHLMVPAWLAEAHLSFDDCIDVVRSHLYTVTQHFRGKVCAWDVVNEAIEADGSWRDTLFLHAFGPEYLTLAFQWAHEGDPDARLFYNDFGAEEINAKSTAIYGMLGGLLDRGVPVHGVGLQMHWELGQPLDPRSMAENIRRLSALGLEIHVTEMDVRIKEPATPKALEDAAKIYREVLEVCLAAPQCTALLTWGVTDRYSWVPAHCPGMGAALLFEAEGRPKPAYFALRDVLASNE